MPQASGSWNEMSASRLARALDELDPRSRAVIDLTLGTEFSDREIATLIHLPPEQVVEQREQALTALAGRSGLGSDREALLSELRRLVAAEPGAEAVATGASTSRRDALTGPAPPATATPERDRRRRRRPLVVALAAVIAAAVLTTLTAGGGEEQPSPEPSSPAGESSDPATSGEEEAATGGGGTAAPPSGDAPEPATTIAALSPVNGPPAGRSVVARLERRGQRELLTVRLRGMPRPRGAYSLWLFDSVAESRRLGRVARGNARIRAALPPPAERYRFLELSYQPPGQRAHSGLSRFRVPLDQLLD